MSGDNIENLPFPAGSADSGPCQTPNASDTACQIINPSSCAVQ